MSDSDPSRTVASAMSITNLIHNPDQGQPAEMSQLSHPNNSHIIWHYVLHVGYTPDFNLTDEELLLHRMSHTLPVRASARVRLYRRCSSQRVKNKTANPVLSSAFDEFFCQGKHEVTCDTEGQHQLNSQLDSALNTAARNKEFAVTVVNAKGWDDLASLAGNEKDWTLLRESRKRSRSKTDWPTQQEWHTFVFEDHSYRVSPTPDTATPATSRSGLPSSFPSGLGTLAPKPSPESRSATTDRGVAQEPATREFSPKIRVHHSKLDLELLPPKAPRKSGSSAGPSAGSA